MARERELKLSAPPGFRLPSFEDEGYVVEPGTSVRLVTTYFDTPDLRLARWGVSLRFRVGEGWTVKLPGGSSEAVVVRDEIEFAGSARRVPPAALELLKGMLRRDQPESVARLRTLRHRSLLKDAEGHAVAEVDEDEVSVIEGRRLAARFRQLEIELREEAADDVLDRLARPLRHAGAAPDPVSKIVRALGPRAEAPPEAAVRKLSSRSPGGDVVSAAIAASTARLIRHDPGVRLGEDPEAVHQARVATRRLRADLRTFGDLVEAEWASQLTEELRWLGGLLGAVRDAEVLQSMLKGLARDLEPAERAAALQVVDRLAGTREDARKLLLEGLGSDRYLDLLETLILAAERPVVTDEAARQASEVLPPLVKAAWRRLRRAVRAMPQVAPDADLHRVRILAKRLRYAAEAAGQALEGYERTAKQAAALQDVLGAHQDAVVAREWLQSVRGGLPPRQAFAAGTLWGLAGAQAIEARRTWTGAWDLLRKETGRSL